jgi:hypothetical protein
MKFTVALLALLTVSLSSGEVVASAATGSVSNSGYQAAAHRGHRHRHHRRHHKLDEGRADVTPELSATV